MIPQCLPDRDENDRRWKRLDLPLDFPLRFAMWEMFQPGLCIAMHKFSTDSIPDGVKCEGVFQSYERQCFSYILYHSTWPAVPIGEMIPPIEEEPRIEIFTLGDNPTRLGKVDSWRDLPSLLGG